MKHRSSNGPYIKRPKYDSEAINKLIWLSDNEPKAKQKKRYDEVILFLKGYSQTEIAEILHTPQRTISSHLRIYLSKGIDGLLLRTSPGAPRKLTASQEQELLDIISTKTPNEAGLGIFANWTIALVCQLVKIRYNIVFSSQGMYDLMKRIGLSCTRPTYVLKKADAAKQEEFLKTWEAVKKTDS